MMHLRSETVLRLHLSSTIVGREGIPRISADIIRIRLTIFRLINKWDKLKQRLSIIICQLYRYQTGFYWIIIIIILLQIGNVILSNKTCDVPTVLLRMIK